MPDTAPAADPVPIEAAALSPLAAVLEEAPGTWSVTVVTPDGGEVFGWQPDRVLRTASSAKVLVLIAAADAVDDGRLALDEQLSRAAVAPVGDSGLWQHLRTESLPVEDVARLIGTVSDNLATNVLTERLEGTATVAAVATELGIHGIDLLDIVRDHRGPADPPTLSRGSSLAYARLFARLAAGSVRNAAVSERVLGWLGDGADLSMVASAFGLDPLAHTHADRGIRLVHKTGTDRGVRADSGVVTRDGRPLAYSCLVEFADADRDAVLRTMRAVGDAVRTAL